MTLNVNVSQNMLREVENYTIDTTFDSNPVAITGSDKVSEKIESTAQYSSDILKNLKHKSMQPNKTIEKIDNYSKLSQESDQENTRNKDLASTIENIEKLSLKKNGSSQSSLEEEKKSKFIRYYLKKNFILNILKTRRFNRARFDDQRYQL